MSFKREGNDGSQLNILRKRRVADLLASFIPEDEALLMKNGRYACTVCHHRPIFDTIDMLSIHRNGKKHTASLQGFYGKKAELSNEVQKRQHRDYVRAEEAGEQLPKGPAPLLAQTRRITHHALLKSAPYNSCCPRKRPGDAGKEIGSPELGAPPPSSVMSHTSQLVSEWPAPQEAAVIQSEPVGRSKKPETKKSVRRKKKDRKCPGKGEETPSDEPEKKREMDHYLRLRSAGWIPDGSGNWVKDENVEFDSDEEEPPPMPPT